MCKAFLMLAMVPAMALAGCNGNDAPTPATDAVMSTSVTIDQNQATEPDTAAKEKPAPRTKSTPAASKKPSPDKSDYVRDGYIANDRLESSRSGGF